jgi:hypothetical protein
MMAMVPMIISKVIAVLLPRKNPSGAERFDHNV